MAEGGRWRESIRGRPAFLDVCVLAGGPWGRGAVGRGGAERGAGRWGGREGEK